MNTSPANDELATITVDLDNSSETTAQARLSPPPPPPPPPIQTFHPQPMHSTQHQYHLRQRPGVPTTMGAVTHALSNGITQAVPSPRRSNSPLRTYSYGPPKKTVADKLAYPFRYLSRMIMPPPDFSKGRDGDQGWRRPPARGQWVNDLPPAASGNFNQNAKLPSAARRACSWIVAASCFLLLCFAAIVGVDVIASNGDANATHTARLIQVFNGENREGRLIDLVKVERTGAFVRNVLDPQHGVETRDDVKALFRKLRTNGGKARLFSDTQLLQGYITYEHEQPLDTDADLLKVNATLDGIERLMAKNALAPIEDGNGGVSSTSEPLYPCESYVQYGIEFNAIVLFNRGAPNDVFYNAIIDERSDEVFDESYDISCRVQRALSENEKSRKSSIVQLERVPRYITLLYTTNEAKRRRRKLVEPLHVACVTHALRLAGFSFDNE